MKRRATLTHRGYLYAQKHVRYVKTSVFEPPPVPSVSESRMMLGIAWRAGYLAAQNDMRRKRAKTPR